MTGTTFVNDGKYIFKYIDPNDKKFITWSQTSNMTTTIDSTSNYTFIGSNGVTSNDISRFGGISLSSHPDNVWYDCRPGAYGDWWTGLAFKKINFPATYNFATFQSSAERNDIELYVWDWI